MLNYNNNKIIAKIPTLLAQAIIKFSINSNIKINKNAHYIQSLSNKVKIEKCIPIIHTNSIFLKGYIYKKIVYYSKGTSHILDSKKSVATKTINIPFDVTTDISYNTSPKNITPSNSKSFTYSNNTHSKIDICFYNNFPFCEIDKIEIIHSKDKVYKEIQEHITSPLGIKKRLCIKSYIYVALQLSVLQKQDIIIF